MHTWQFWGFHDDINVNVGTEVFQTNSWQQFVGERIEKQHTERCRITKKDKKVHARL
jgi:hypothetical protein